MGQLLYFCKILNLTNRYYIFLAPESPTIGMTKVSQLASCRGKNFIDYDSLQTIIKIEKSVEIRETPLYS